MSDGTPTGQMRTSTSPRPADPGASPAAQQAPRTAATAARPANDIGPESKPKAAPRKAPVKKRPPRTGPRPAAGAPRRVRLTVARVDPWSVMKLVFLLSVAIGIAMVVAAGVLWTVLDGMGVFADINGVVGELFGSGRFDVNDYVGFGKVVSLGTVLAVVNVVLVTALSTLGAFLYNISANLVGGLHTTLSDD